MAPSLLHTQYDDERQAQQASIQMSFLKAAVQNKTRRTSAHHTVFLKVQAAVLAH